MFLLKFFLISILVIATPAMHDRRNRLARWNEDLNTRTMIEAFYPKGIRVSIADSEGVKSFAFHANINKRIRRGDPGDLHFEVHEAKHGRWSYFFPNLSLFYGDAVNFWIQLQMNDIKRDFPKRRKYIKNVISLPSGVPPPFNERQPTNRPQGNSLCPCNQLINMRGQHSSSASASAQSSSSTNSYPTPEIHQNQCNYTQLGLLKDELETSNSKIESMNELLEDIIKELNIGTKLFYTFKNSRPPGVNAVDEIKTFITDNLELLDLENQIAQASFENNGILFIVKHPVDKKRILFRAMKKLTNSNHQISDPEVGGTNTNTGNNSASKPANNNFDELVSNVFNNGNSDINESDWRVDNHGIPVKPISQNNSVILPPEPYFKNKNEINQPEQTATVLVPCPYNSSLSELKPEERCKNPTQVHECNLTHIAVLENEIEISNSKIQSITELLKDIFKEYTIGTQLFYTFKNSRPPGINAVDEIKTFITDNLELLDLENEIVQASFKNDGILFEVRNEIEKKRILFRAMKKLKNSNHQIIDPEDPAVERMNLKISSTTLRNENSDEIKHFNKLYANIFNDGYSDDADDDDTE